jgi:adenine phosphoribosyltransferase
VLIVDDLLATGGTAKAAVGLVKQLGGTVSGLAFLIELVELNGRAKLPGEDVMAVLKY